MGVALVLIYPCGKAWNSPPEGALKEGTQTYEMAVRQWARNKKFIRTTDSEHGLAVYPNLVPTLDISAVNQLWVADITYIRLLREFVYLAVVLDAFSRRVIGWSLGRTLEAELALAALRTALRTREIGPGLVHHSDRGVQYASGDYTKLLQQHGISISMSRKANPYDNAMRGAGVKAAVPRSGVGA